jgi:hypothetical protein
MIVRAILSIFLCLCALVVGILAVWLTARNRERSSELDTTQHWCEVYARQNELLRAQNRREEWELLSSLGVEPVPVETTVVEVER